ncbi:hypothetical protein Q7C36_015951 [Tachysurus vachellii]|uniref:Uncharacterized protein n=1 Tax=Tachysurus vachellii TaxID=175792 RepID=A0AA88SG28_TACVA|nr:hypothetical protein Q7C36_015951 [Tachysurus vachellii]
MAICSSLPAASGRLARSDPTHSCTQRTALNAHSTVTERIIHTWLTSTTASGLWCSLLTVAAHLQQLTCVCVFIYVYVRARACVRVLLSARTQPGHTFEGDPALICRGRDKPMRRLQQHNNSCPLCD